MPMKELIKAIAKILVDEPDRVHVHAVEYPHMTLFELRVSQGDMGKLIGKQGRNAQAIRTLLNAAAAKLKHRFQMEILDGSDDLRRPSYPSPAKAP